ncbi:uncharacterized protein N7503_009754 [Penicillium pulvis]|uniref:uncharacterized protein n=1 Tax=Penicillium pulvis TaxID=1562058 RepID=UPI002546828C|nr:uncharacterized protein N7503_009754 [Penicillium pulvis]KAJ5784542.1 hypothetical protein N7503_009754 [Penicillium pulvis]
MPEIPFSAIRVGDFILLGGRACQVIRIDDSSDQPKYIGVDIFTNQLREETASGSIMMGPDFKYYRPLDMSDGFITGMDEMGTVKQEILVLDVSNLWSRLVQAFESRRGPVWAWVLTDKNKDLVVNFDTQLRLKR